VSDAANREFERQVADAILDNLWSPDGTITILPAARAAIAACAAQWIEAQRATTTKIGVVHESPVAESDAPNPSAPNPHPIQGEYRYE
jgi:hypothetical protein